ESLNTALEKYQGTLFFVSHDRVFVDSLATRILEISAGKITDFKGTYSEFLASRGLS
ncbi:MAG: ABC-F family ATPase, partial [Enterovibrio sp.]